MHLVALVDHPDHVCCRYRVSSFAKGFADAGHSLELRVLPRRWWSRLALYHQLRGASVLVQRRLLPRWELALLRRWAKHLLFDFDDAVFLRDSYARRGLHHPRKERMFAAMMRACDAVIAGNGFLVESAAQWASPDRVHLIPTCVDPQRYTPRREIGSTDGMSLTWIGSSSTLQGLESIAPLLNELGRAIPELRLQVICDRFPRFEHLPVVDRPWSATNEASDLAAGDIGISWIPDDLWSRGKCGLKVLQYMASGLPVVANPVGVHPEMIRHGVTGYLATSPGEWIAAVKELSASPELRARMGRAGRAEFETHYSVAAGNRSWQRILMDLERRSAKAC